MTSGTRTDIATIIAGDEVGFRIDLWNAPVSHYWASLVTP